jgi:cell division protein ZapA (FtsZ GTPase activity inhibitor)
MGDKDGARPVPVQITVFNQTYRVVATDGGERAWKVARLVDARMREIASQITTHEVGRIAVLAALGIADELLTWQEMHGTQGEASVAPGESAPAPPGDDADAHTPARNSWFEAVFDADLGSAERRADRMSSKFAERLQSARQSGEVAPIVGHRREIVDGSMSLDVRRKERMMTEQHKPRHDEKAERILRWLYEHRTEFESSGVNEGSLAAAVGLSDEEVTEAVDHLENREAVARLPQHDATSTGFLLEPARGWADVCEELGEGAAANEKTT